MKKINIAIDGPGGAGKSTLAKKIAAVLNINYVDTGAIYRTVGLAAREAGVSPDDAEAVTELLGKIRVELKFEDGRQNMYLNGVNLGDRIREHIISDYASKVSAIPAVRAFLLDTQRNTAKTVSTVMDGRDIGTVILPDADVKIFLTASPETRARRRVAELRERGQDCDYESVLADMAERDRRDSQRAVAPLKAADDAVLLDNSGLDLDGTVSRALEIIDAKVPGLRA